MPTKVLLVQSDKNLANLISKKIESTLKYKVDFAYKLSEAKLFLKSCKYLSVIIDSSIEDSSLESAIDYTIKQGHQVIVLSDNNNKEYRKNMLKKNIIDFIKKSGNDDINYILSLLKRLKKNQKHTVLIVDDSIIFRKQMKTMLENLCFKVITVAHGEEALNILDTFPNISLVLTDYNMPVMNGLELTTNIRKIYSKNELGVIALSASEDGEIISDFLKVGASDFIKKPFSRDEFSCRINNNIESLENMNIITNQINRDYLTGLYNHRYFVKHMEEYMENNHEKFAIGILSIDNFKEMIKEHGEESVDKVVVFISEVLRSNTNYQDVVAKFIGEEFCVVLKNINIYSTKDIFDRLYNSIQKAIITSDKDEIIDFTISIGVVLSSEDSLDDMIGNADLLLHTAKKSGGNQVIYS